VRSCSGRREASRAWIRRTKGSTLLSVLPPSPPTLPSSAPIPRSLSHQGPLPLPIFEGTATKTTATAEEDFSRQDLRNPLSITPLEILPDHPSRPTEPFPRAQPSRRHQIRSLPLLHPLPSAPVVASNPPSVLLGFRPFRRSPSSRKTRPREEDFLVSSTRLRRLEEQITTEEEQPLGSPRLLLRL